MSESTGASNYAPRPSPEQAELIDNLGGPSIVAECLTKQLRLAPALRPQTVSQWKRRGIPYRYRAALAIEAREGGVCVPVGFLGEPEGAQ